jgi:hypothetical protein
MESGNHRISEAHEDGPCRDVSCATRRQSDNRIEREYLGHLVGTKSGTVGKAPELPLKRPVKDRAIGARLILR